MIVGPNDTRAAAALALRKRLAATEATDRGYSAGASRRGCSIPSQEQPGRHGATQSARAHVTPSGRKEG
jgi:hypothetical protein